MGTGLKWNRADNLLVLWWIHLRFKEVTQMIGQCTPFCTFCLTEYYILIRKMDFLDSRKIKHCFMTTKHAQFTDQEKFNLFIFHWRSLVELDWRN